MLSFPLLSAFVVSYNRAAIVGTCLRGLRFADEVIVVDKSSTDATPSIAAALADRVISVPWSPTVEDTRAFAAAQCTHEWVLFLDDDECLSPETAAFLRHELAAPRADAYAFPLRHYILGAHDERAYYWPEHHVRCFRRGSVTFGRTVHAGLTLPPDRVWRIPPETGVCIHHLSHQDSEQWIEKANRYTSCADRARVAHTGQDLAGFAHGRIEHWLAHGSDASPGGYPSAVALLRAVYDIIDRLKTWEEERGLDGAAQFAAVCSTLDAAYGAPLDTPAAAIQQGHVPPAPALAVPALVHRRFADLRAEHDATVGRLTAATAAAEQRAAAAEQHAAQADRRSLAAEAGRLAAADAQQMAMQRAIAAEATLRAIRTSVSWRATAWPRRMVDWLRHLSVQQPQACDG